MCILRPIQITLRADEAVVAYAIIVVPFDHRDRNRCSRVSSD